MAVKKGATAVRTAKPVEKKALAKAKEPPPPIESQEDVDAKEARNIWEFPELADVLPALCERYREISEQTAALEEERKELSETIMPLLKAVDQRSIKAETWVAVIAHGGQSKIIPELLLQNGVTLEQINASKKKISYDYLQVRDPRRQQPGGNRSHREDA